MPRLPPLLRLALALLVAALGMLVFARKAEAKEGSSTPDAMTLEVPGFPDAYYYKPRSKTRRPIVLYLHGRGGNAFEDCRKWARVARQFGWIVCPQGPMAIDTGGHSWSNDPQTAMHIIDATVAALREKFPGRLRKRGNILIGFSEGAFIAQQVGLRDPLLWNRWLI